MQKVFKFNLPFYVQKDERKDDLEDSGGGLTLVAKAKCKSTYFTAFGC